MEPSNLSRDIRLEVILQKYLNLAQGAGSKVEKLTNAFLVNCMSAMCSNTGSTPRHLVLLPLTKYRSILYKLGRLPHKDLVSFILDRFRSKDKNCPKEVAETISTTVKQHPYYSQKLSFYEFEMTTKKAAVDDVAKAYERVIEEERFFFEATLQGITLKQASLLIAIANSPNLPIFSAEFLNKFRLAQGMIQKALPKLSKLDLIEKNEENTWRIVDPLFEDWLKRR